MLYTIDELRRKITPIAIAYGVESVSLFGSYAKGYATPESDIDLKIEKGKIRTLFQLSDFRLDVEEALALPVDLVTASSSDTEFLRGIQNEEVLLYRNA